MAVGDRHMLAQAARVLRTASEPGWDALEARVIDAVRATPRGGWPIAVADPRPGPADGVLAVSDLVVRSLLARTLRADGEVAPLDIEVDVADGVLRAVRVRLVGRYGADLRAATARALDRCTNVLADVIGPTPAVVEVAVVDVDR
ncbi:hypothetical protein [Mycobacterium sp. 852013-51886_SCH5428379]|uniref:hypothetical protein n=1 Tax=Mycobacterium sp. 852013-51886_SCH5428379 TaxID=1834111 RepID=UPI0012E9723F|nr:hypothetical protein [Mycobacterium sp. 852013-51886_SCH5428379]